MRRIDHALMTGLATTLLLPVATAYASTNTRDYVSTNIDLNGVVVTSPEHTTAVDPSSNQATSFMPIWYAMQALKQLGITSKWDGTTWSLSVPLTLHPDLSKPVTATNDMYISMNGVRVESTPKLVAVDPSSKTSTTFVPIYYLEQVLKRIGVSSSWNGSTWAMTTNTASASKSIYPSKYPASVPISKSISGDHIPSVTTLVDQAKAVFSSISYTNQGNYRVFKVPVFTAYSGWQINVAYYSPTKRLIHGVVQNQDLGAQWSYNNGKTWHTARANYTNIDPMQGEITSIPPYSPGYVLIRGPKSAIAGFGFGWRGKNATSTEAFLRVNPNGTVFESFSFN